jgi:hypothetical protein
MSGREVVDLVASSEDELEAQVDEVVAQVVAPGAKRKRPRPEAHSALDALLAQQLHDELNCASGAGDKQPWRAETQALSGDLSPLLRRCLSVAAAEVRLCEAPILFLAQSDKWSCGYRCLQMMLAALRYGSAVHDAALCFPGIGPKGVPDVRSIQLGVDLAHLAGIDPEGFEQSGIFHGGRGWLGATDGKCASLTLCVHRRAVAASLDALRDDCQI